MRLLHRSLFSTNLVGQWRPEDAYLATTKKVEKNNYIDPVKLRGPCCQHYQEDSTKRSKSRANIVDGLLKKMKDLKTTTNNDSLLVFFTDIATAQKFATNMPYFHFLYLILSSRSAFVYLCALTAFKTPFKSSSKLKHYFIINLLEYLYS